MKQSVIILIVLFMFSSCKKKESDPVPPEPMLIFKFKFDSTQVRLNGFGSPASVAAGNAAQSPVFNKMSAHYIELAPDSLTQVGNGKILYNGATTTLGGSSAIDFDKEVQVGQGGTFFSVPIKDVTPGTYKWLRVSLAYQNYVVKFRTSVPVVLNLSGTLASFVGFNTYIKSFKVKDSIQLVNSNKRQGFWAFETAYTLDSASAPGTTVSNPISLTSPIPPGSCLATGRFQPDFTITGNENKDIIITVSLSTNKSFEWTDPNANGIWEPDLGNEPVVDMGLRGLIPFVQY
jgi:hypothetical protein